MKKVFLLFTLLLLLPFSNVKALFCSFDNLANLKRLASNINTSYSYVENNNNVTFTITIVNVPDNMYIIDTSNQKTYTGKEINITDYKNGASVKFEVYSNVTDCEKELLYTIRLTLPSYNAYYKDPLCQDLKDYYLCQKWSSHGLSYDKFKDKIEAYRNSQIKEPPKEDIEQSGENWWSQVLAIILKYYYIPLIIAVIGSTIGIYVINKKSNTYS